MILLFPMTPECMLIHYNQKKKRRKLLNLFSKECPVSETELGNQLAVDSEEQSSKISGTVAL